VAVRIRRRLTSGRQRDSQGRMSVIDHLTELRSRLIKAVIAVAIGAVLGFVLYNRILHLLLQPYCQVHHKAFTGCSLYASDPLEPFLVRIKVASWTGFILASPVVFWQLWRFITPGLNPKEKKYAVPFVVSSVVLFLLGGLVAWLTFPKALDFLVGVGGPSLLTIFSPGKYLRLVILMIVAFGLAFEFPVLLVFLELAGVVSSRQLSKWRRPAIVVIFIVAAVITPSQDPWSLFAMAIPMCLFYEGSILLGRLLKR
jgi:sec-independent protein translocase protein TatC